MFDKLKAAWRSKTIWFNAVLAALPLALDQLASALPMVREYLPQNTYQTLMVVAVLGNVVLRFVTRVPLEAK